MCRLQTLRRVIFPGQNLHSIDLLSNASKFVFSPDDEAEPLATCTSQFLALTIRDVERSLEAIFEFFCRMLKYIICVHKKELVFFQPAKRYNFGTATPRPVVILIDITASCDGPELVFPVPSIPVKAVQRIQTVMEARIGAFCLFGLAHFARLVLIAAIAERSNQPRLESFES